jgi:hypothetical protein
MHHIFIQDNVIQDVSHLCASNPTGAYNDAGVRIGSGASNIYVIHNSINSTSLNQSACTLSPSYDSPGDGIYRMGTSAGTFVLSSNTITGGFRDGIGGEGAGSGVDNYDVSYNIVSGQKDDGIEMDGDNMNTRIYGNNVNNDKGNSALSNAPTVVGPAYIFRNTFRVSSPAPGGAVAFKLGGGSVGFSFYIHNSIDTSPSPTPAQTFSNAGGGNIDNHYLLNNVIKTSNHAISHFMSSCSLDYNDYFPSVSGYALFEYWNGLSGNTYMTVADFRTATGQEPHGIQQDPLFADNTLHLSGSSLAIDKAMPLANFNGPNSAWPTVGSGPDMGAYEYGTGSSQVNLPHPADTNTDYLMSLDEATHFSYCWKVGTPIPSGCPNPAPSDYQNDATRAGTLWSSTNDGRYTYDSSKICPQCWVPAP